MLGSNSLRKGPI